MIVLDTHAWIEYFIGSERGATAGEYIEKGEKIVTPDIVLAEIARKYPHNGIGAGEVKKGSTTSRHGAKSNPSTQN